jgi:predicted translin family RNA/ssDNA-binding protein
LGLDTYSKPNGFITEYSKSTASEDMAEVFSHLMNGKLPNKIDPILKKKLDFIKKNLLKIDKNFIL